MAGGVATFTNNPNANTGITLSGNLGPSTIPIQGGAGASQIQGAPITIQGTGAPKGISVSTPGSVAGSGAAVNAATSQNNSLNAQIAALQAQIAAANQKVYAPALDTGAIFKQAADTAAANVNPYYTKLLNDFITNQGVQKQQEQDQTTTNIGNLQTQLQQLLQQNATTGERAGEDATTATDAINTAADERQQDQGTAFNTARNTEAKTIAGQGLTGSGIAAGEQATSQATQDTTEARQAEADATAKSAAALTKARTFEDLATSGANATTTEGQGEQQANFDLNKFITGQTSDLQGEQQTLEQQRQGALQTEQENQTKILVNNFINSISDPAQRQAAISTYGGL